MSADGSDDPQTDALLVQAAQKLARWRGWMYTLPPHDALAAIYRDADLLAPEGSEGGAEYFVSDEPAGFEPFIRLFVGANDGPVTRVAIDNY